MEIRERCRNLRLFFALLETETVLMENRDHRLRRLVKSMPSWFYLFGATSQISSDKNRKEKKKERKTKETGGWHESLEIPNGSRGSPSSDRHNPAVKPTKYIIPPLHILKGLQTWIWRLEEIWTAVERRRTMLIVCVCVACRRGSIYL